MPRVELHDMNGQRYIIDTYDMSKVGAWLQEWVPILASSDYARDFLRLQVWPLPDPVTGKPDLTLPKNARVPLEAQGAAEVLETLRVVLGLDDDARSSA